MYVIRSRKYGTFFNDRATFISSVDTVQEAKRFDSVSDALTALMERHYVWCDSTEICKLTITPGATVRREVPLGTPGRKVAIRGVFSENFLAGDCFGAALEDATLYAGQPEAISVIVKNRGCLGDVELVGILEETTEETLTATPLE